MKQFKLILALVFASSAIVACSEDDNTSQSNTIVDIAASTPQLSSLVTAIDAAGLSSTLAADGSYTVFAPTNEAFQALLDSNPDWNSLSDIPTATLDMVLKYHVLANEVPSSALSDTYVNTLAMAQNEALSLQITTTGGVIFDGSAAPVQVDIIADNGIVHIIDKVMLPNNVVEFALQNPNFSSLVAALTDTRHTTNFVNVLNGSGPFTIFAPTNDAFQDLLDSNSNWNSLADIPIATLEAVLLYHVVNGANVQADQLSDDMTINTMGGELMTDLSNGAMLETSSGQSVNIIITDVQATNGVIHAVDEVLIP